MSDDKDDKKDIKQRSYKDRRSPTDRRLLNLGFGRKGKDRRKIDQDRRVRGERRENWGRVSRWSSVIIREDDDE